jgi:hypothetical protein
MYVAMPLHYNWLPGQVTVVASTVYQYHTQNHQEAFEMMMLCSGSNKVLENSKQVLQTRRLALFIELLSYTS